MLTNIISISLGAILVNNFIFSQFLGCCPFLGCSSKVETATGMGLPDPDRPSALGYTAVPDNMEALRKALGTAFCPQDILVDSIGSTIGTHVGPGAAAIVYFKKNQS